MPINIRIRRGQAANLPVGATGEPLWAEDTKQLYVGNGDGTNTLVASGSEFEVPVTSVAGKTGDVTLNESDIAGLVADLAATEKTSNKGQANGYAPLDANGLIPNSAIPPLAISVPYVVGSQAAMFALTAQRGDVAIRTDIGESFILSADDPTQLSNWIQILTPPAPVISVNGKAGTVNLLTSDVSESTNLYFTDARADARITAQRAQANGIASLDASGNVPVTQLANVPTAPVVSVAGKTGAVTLSESDVSNLVADLAAKAPTASPELSGNLTVYGLRTDASNYEKFSVQTTPINGRLYINYDRAGTGTARSWWIQNNSGNGFLFYGGSITILKQGTYGNAFIFDPDTVPGIFTIATTAGATSSVAASSAKTIYTGRYWNGSASADDSWTVQNVLSNGTNGASTFTFTHAGSSGKAAVQAPIFQLPGGLTWSSGSGTPEGVVTAPVGSIYSRTDGGAGSTLYIKESGTGTTGWVAK